MAGSAMTFAYDRGNSMRTITVDWTSDDTTGAVSGTTRAVVGNLVRFVTDPDGVAAPDDNYDIDLLDANGASLFGATSLLLNRDTANIEAVVPTYRIPTDSTITVSVSAAGNSKEGQLIIYIEGPDF